MKICDAIRPDLVFLGLRAGTGGEAIDVIARELSAASKLDQTRVAAALVEREKLGSTSVGNGFAIPHCKLGKLSEIVVALARFDTGVDFGDSKNHEPVRFFFVVLSPPDQPAEHLQVLSQIARILKNTKLQNELLGAVEIPAITVAIQHAALEEGL